MSGLVRVDAADGIATLTVDNPPVNSLTLSVLEALADAAGHVSGDSSVRVVVITGGGSKAFAAGADLSELEQAPPGSNWIEGQVARSKATFERLHGIPQPVVAAVQASAVGGGLELALICDFIVADPAALFGLPEVRVGLIPGAGGTQRLPRRIGLIRAKEMVFFGHLIDAAEALSIGLINRVSEPGAALGEAHSMAATLANLSAVSVQAIKRAMREETEGLAIGLELERALFREVFSSRDAREGIRAFLERRSPAFAHA
jgi:enoyl-CoA hydratase/carnithine racemase